MRAKSLSHVRLFATQWTVACQLPLSTGFPRQEYWIGLPCPPPVDLPNPGMEPTSLMWVGRQIFYHWRHPESPYYLYSPQNYVIRDILSPLYLVRNLNLMYIFPLFHLLIGFSNPVTIRNRLPMGLLLFFMKSSTIQTHQHAPSSDSVLCKYMSLLGQTESCASLYLKKDLSICRELTWGFWRRDTPSFNGGICGAFQRIKVSLPLVMTCFLFQLMGCILFISGPLIPTPQH